MASSSAITHCSSPISSFSRNSSTSLPLNRISYFSVSFKTNSRLFNRLSIKSSSASSVSAEGLAPAISLTENAVKHLKRMKSERGDDLCLRVGVKQGGCSGMSYTMDFESTENVKPDDSLIEHNGVTIVCDPKSLLVLYGVQLDYSDALMGAGFKFKNPNAKKACSCGKSFAA